jgi:hypothetical protein
MRIEKECGDDPRKPFWLMTLSYGESMAEAAIRWCDRTLAELGEAAEAV